MKRKISLMAVPTPAPGPKATILKLGVAPAFKGTDHEDLLCAGCGAVLASGVALSTLADRFAVPEDLLLICPCGMHNRLPAQIQSGH